MVAGGHRKILMADLKDMLSEMGFENVSTYIQSGNVIFSTNPKTPNAAIEEKMAAAIHTRFGHDVPVIVRTQAELEDAITTNPFYDPTHIERLHLTFLKELPGLAALEQINSHDVSPDQFEVIGNHVFAIVANKFRDTKLTNKFYEGNLKTSATTRNWKTVMKLGQLVQGK